jgi:catechol 2,3-dioxygenase
MTDERFNHAAAPLRIKGISLRVQDLEGVTAFYHKVLGLAVLERSARQVTLGFGGEALLDLIGEPSARTQDPSNAGLFHTAFLLPARADLARWLTHALRLGVPLQGASDHIVSEAIYLADPEGNGIEVYADRPISHWRAEDGSIRMATDSLDVQDLLAAVSGAWDGFPDGGIIGHVHLQVGEAQRADGFYRDILGFDISSRYPGASFYSSGGYHHHLAGNVWNSRGAPLRPTDAAGLEAVRIGAGDADLRDRILERADAAALPVAANGDVSILHDPWGNAIALSA